MRWWNQIWNIAKVIFLHNKAVYEINIPICTLFQAFWEILFSIWDSSSSSSSWRELEWRIFPFDHCPVFSSLLLSSSDCWGSTTTASSAAILASNAVLNSSRLWGEVFRKYLRIPNYLMVHMKNVQTSQTTSWCICWRSASFFFNSASSEAIAWLFLSSTLSPSWSTFFFTF